MNDTATSIWHPKSDRRLARLERLESATGDKYCHAELVMLAMIKREPGDDLEGAKESARQTWLCKKESEEIGSCWCRKFTREDEKG